MLETRRRIVRAVAAAGLLCVVVVAAASAGFFGSGASWEPAIRSSLFSRGSDAHASLLLAPGAAASAPLGATLSVAALTRAESPDTSLDELLAPALVRQIERDAVDCLTPMHVHLVWIGDIADAPPTHVKYAEMGFNLTVHSNPEEILDGFHPYVRKAFAQAIPKVVGYDFLKLALLYKHGGLVGDADTFPSIQASELVFPGDCDVVFGKENHIGEEWTGPVFREHGGPVYGFARPYQVLNWAMVARSPRNKHVRALLLAAMAHFLGQRDMNYLLIQDIAGSGLMTDYAALTFTKAGWDYAQVYMDRSRHYPVEGLCLTETDLIGGWIHHTFLSSWKHKHTEEKTAGQASGSSSSSSSGAGRDPGAGE